MNKVLIDKSNCFFPHPVVPDNRKKQVLYTYSCSSLPHVLKSKRTIFERAVVLESGFPPLFCV